MGPNGFGCPELPEALGVGTAKKNADLRLASAIVEEASSCPEAFSGFGGAECPEALIGMGAKPGQPRNPKPKARHTMYVQHPKPTESRRAVCAVPPRQ